MPPVPDRLFADRRLAGVYDPLDPDRSDLDVYAAIAAELGARTVLDLGCGTGTFAVLLAARGFDVTGVDPAAASVDVARAKPGADRVRWVVGEIDAVADLRFDLVTMTGNVAQVFVTDEAWQAVLATAYDVLLPGGHLVFETRDPAREAWREWTREDSSTVAHTPSDGRVESWVEVTDLRDELVTFRSTLVFAGRHDHLGVDPALPQPRLGDRRSRGGRVRRRRRPRRSRPARPGAGVRRDPSRRVTGPTQGRSVA